MLLIFFFFKENIKKFENEVLEHVIPSIIIKPFFYDLKFFVYFIKNFFSIC